MNYSQKWKELFFYETPFIEITYVRVPEINIELVSKISASVYTCTSCNNVIHRHY